MEYANGGSLDAFIDARRGGSALNEDDSTASTRQRKERHRLRKLGAVHLLRLDEILTLFEDITTGLGFLHARNILHLDLKAENVLLHWEEDDLLPRAKLSDFGNATSDAFRRERSQSQRAQNVAT
jgi:serine/threonine protein kinase